MLLADAAAPDGVRQGTHAAVVQTPHDAAASLDDLADHVGHLGHVGLRGLDVQKQDVRHRAGCRGSWMAGGCCWSFWFVIAHKCDVALGPLPRQSPHQYD